MSYSPLISVIIPVFNAGKYLKRCLNSVVNQTYENLEILLINDGSTDNSLSLCQEYALKDSRIVLINQKNHGQGFTRCYGIKICKGDLIAFVDDDDYILPQMYEKMLHCLYENDVDVCVCQWNYELQNGTHSISKKQLSQSIFGFHSSVEFSHFLYNNGGYLNGVVVSPWNKLYKSCVIKGAEFGGLIGEEEEMNDWINCKNCRVFVMKDEFYFWCDNSSSVTHHDFSSARFHFLEILIKRISSFHFDDYIVNESKLLFCNMFVEYYFKAREKRIKMPKKMIFYFNHLLFSLMQIKFQNKLSFFIRMCIFKISPSIYNILVHIK